jgi:hypothetical protein
MDFERDIKGAEEKLMQEFGFAKEEINYVMRYKPIFILHELEKHEGINALRKVLVQERGFQPELVRTLVVRYPYIIGKTEKDI